MAVKFLTRYVALSYAQREEPAGKQHLPSALHLDQMLNTSGCVLIRYTSKISVGYMTTTSKKTYVKPSCRN